MVKADNQKRTLIEHLARHMTWPRFLFALSLTVFLTSILFPFYWMVSSSFKTSLEIAGRTPTARDGHDQEDAQQ